MPVLKAFVKSAELQSWPGVNVNFITHHKPELVIFGDDDAVVKRIELTKDMELEEIRGMISFEGFPFEAKEDVGLQRLPEEALNSAKAARVEL